MIESNLPKPLYYVVKTRLGRYVRLIGNKGSEIVADRRDATFFTQREDAECYASEGQHIVRTSLPVDIR